MSKKILTAEKRKCLQQALDAISTSILNIDGWGSVEVIIQDNAVTQITEKNIRKPILQKVKRSK
ncbi:MAG: DUF2292 domain-containing protein [Patescibacteria group bacterium]|nr:DUF2292 domain-containing protein [Patescibacteria group bacterium]